MNPPLMHFFYALIAPPFYCVHNDGFRVLHLGKKRIKLIFAACRYPAIRRDAQFIKRITVL